MKSNFDFMLFIKKSLENWLRFNLYKAGKNIISLDNYFKKGLKVFNPTLLRISIFDMKNMVFKPIEVSNDLHFSELEKLVYSYYIPKKDKNKSGFLVSIKLDISKYIDKWNIKIKKIN